MAIPSKEEIQELHEKYAPSPEALESVWLHCQIVEAIALQVAEQNNIPKKDLISAGALLHDIGVYRLYLENGKQDRANYVTHGLRGYELLRKEMLPDSLCRFALHHTGVELTKEDITQHGLPLPFRDYLPESEQEWVVLYADKFHSKSASPTFNSAEWYTNYLDEKFGKEKAIKFKELVNRYGEPHLNELSKNYNQPIR